LVTSATILERRDKVTEKKKDWQHSKGSRSPNATNDSWRALDSISGLKDSGNIAGVRDASPRFLKGVAKVEEKEQDWRRQVGTDAILMREAF
jgi:hypothetical protein